MEIRKCKKCGEEMHEDFSPKVASLANEQNEIPKQIKVWRCKNGHIEPHD